LGNLIANGRAHVINISNISYNPFKYTLFKHVYDSTISLKKNLKKKFNIPQAKRRQFIDISRLRD